jgi:hypothetical protein
MGADAELFREMLATLQRIETQARRTADALEALRAEVAAGREDARSALAQARGDAPRFGSF